MEQLTKRQIIALEILKGHRGLIDGNEDKQATMISNALDFADYFIDISEDEQGTS